MKRPNTPPCNGRGRRAFLGSLVGLGLAARAAWGEETQGGAQADASNGTVQTVQIGYLRWTVPRPTISISDKPASNNGLAGAKLAIQDDNTTGRFMGQQFELVDVPLREDDDPVAELGKLAGRGVLLVMTDTPGEIVLKLANAAAGQKQTIFNIAAPDDALRGADCRADLVNVAPSRAMLADAVAQYLVLKRWSRWFLVQGSHPEDKLLADAYRRSAKRFGAKIVEEKTFTDIGGSRQTDTGLTQTAQQMAVFTQNVPNYDVLVAADENEVFAGYLPYHTWDARPVVGSAGMRPTTWDPNSVSWGGEQLQSRFTRLFKRDMTALDMQAWTACRMIGEAASRTRSTDPAQIMTYMRSPGFGVAAYKGQQLTLRDWDWQLRQPILLSDGRNVVTTSPQPGFLHQVTELDTLGIDRPETTCKLH
jgi:ABC transporter substrate binding protein (PQQ-dependent alcohol dehydrogenase system)